MKSFDEWFENRHTKSGLYEEALCGKADAKYIRHEIRKAYLAGQQSKQAEVDELIDTIKTSAESEMYLFDELQKVKSERDELQKRIDEALNKSEDFYDFGDGESAMAFCNEIINILKGDQS